MGNRGSRIDSIDDDAEERAFLRLLGTYGEPARIEPPPDLVTRIGRRLATDAIHDNQRTSFVRILQFGLLGLITAFALAGAWAMVVPGPASPVFGTGASGLGRALLTAQLLLKPLVGTFSAVILPMLLVGGFAAFSSVWLIRRYRPAEVSA